MQKLFQQQKRNACAKLQKKSAEWNFSKWEISLFFNLSKIYSAEFFLVFPVSS